VSIVLPPLCERREDIPLLVEHLLKTRGVTKGACRVDPPAMQALINYPWPGNIRELANVLERAQILAEEGVITMDDLPESFHTASQATAGAAAPSDAGPLNLTQLERHATQNALAQAKGNKVHAAKLLGITRRSLYRLIEKYGFDQHAHGHDGEA
jgi:DNA-binding NtrC family response regulator